MWIRTTTLINDLRSTWRTHNQHPHQNPDENAGQNADAGYASEAVLVTALLILGAIIVIGIIVAKVTSKANEIDLALLVLTTAAP